MYQSNFNLAMDLSENLFAYHLCGVMSALSESGLPCPDPEAEALRYLQTFHADALLKEDADANNETSELELS